MQELGFGLTVLQVRSLAYSLAQNMELLTGSIPRKGLLVKNDTNSFEKDSVFDS
jgi:hypothetical protein